ncbi:MAG TPA: pitrilysin family protein [Gemmatimonadaceae bacterium]|jgi:zinc protease|nr:pitrilysin family protein [Gemmatimonadaceae bacterium]
MRFSLGLFGLALAGPALCQRVDRAAQPVAPRAAPFKFPTIRAHRLPNGLRLLVVEDHSIPVVAVRAIVGADSTSDPPGKEGLYDVTLGALGEGSTTRSPDELAAAAAALGTAIVPTGFTTVSSAFVPALGLMSEMLTKPAFDSTSIERRKTAQLAAARRIAQAPVTIPRRLFYSLVYGANDPFVRSLIPTEATVASISRADVIAFYGRFFTPPTTTLAIAGDVTDSAALDAATRTFGGWQATSSPRDAEVKAVTARDTHIYLQDVPNAGTQAYLYVGAVGPSRTDSDAVATEAFAAVATARLQETLREKRSFIYSSTTGLTWRHAGAEGAFVGSANVSAQKADSALAEWLRILRELRTTRPPTAGELDAVRSARVGVLPSRIDGPDSIVTRLVEIARDRLPLDFFERYASRMSSVTLADLKLAAARHVDVAHLVIVVTGDARVLEPVLGAVKLAPVTVLPPQRGSAP